MRKLLCCAGLLMYASLLLSAPAPFKKKPTQAPLKARISQCKVMVWDGVTYKVRFDSNGAYRAYDSWSGSWAADGTAKTFDLTESCDPSDPESWITYRCSIGPDLKGKVISSHCNGQPLSHEAGNSFELKKE